MFVGQQYLPISPRSVALASLETPQGGVQVAGIAASSSEHVFGVVEWDDRPRATNSLLSVSAPQASSFRDSLVEVGANISSFCALAYGDCELCFPISLGDGTIRVVFRNIDDEIDGAVHYQLYGGVLRNEGPWSACCVAERKTDGGRIVGVRPDGTFAVVDVSNNRLSLHAVYPMSTSGLSRFPITQLVPLQGVVNAFLARCHHAVLRVQLEHDNSSSVVVRAASISLAWRWSPHDPLTSVALRDNMITGGSEDGSVVLWNLSQCAGANNTPSECLQNCNGNGAVTAVAFHDAMEFATGSADGSIHLWQRRDTVMNASFSPARLWPRDCGEYISTGLHGFPSIVAVEANHKCLVAVDDSGVLLVWCW